MPLRVVDAPLALRSELTIVVKVLTRIQIPCTDGMTLVQDLLAIHMVRTTTTSTIISYHPHSNLHKISAERLQSVLQRACQSVYWSKTFRRASSDSTFVFITVLRYILKTWDEAFEAMYCCLNELVCSTTLILILNFHNSSRKMNPRYMAK